jgi:regulation of enolase protein 1 (concanavalin A-like superfamily)
MSEPAAAAAAGAPAPAPMTGAILTSPSFTSGDGSDGSSLTWFSPPPFAAASGGTLKIRTSQKTDAWSNTFYGFPDPQPHNAHALFSVVEGDFEAEVTVEAFPGSRYDQAGLMLRLQSSPTQNWIKTSLEYIPDGPSHLGSVVTNRGWSDWATQDAPSSSSLLQFRIKRIGADYLIFSRPGEGGAADWSQIRMCHLHDDEGKGQAVQVGLYACSPLECEGFEAHFTNFVVRRTYGKE